MNVFGPVWAGFVYDRVMPSAPYWIGANLLLSILVLLMFLDNYDSHLFIH